MSLGETHAVAFAGHPRLIRLADGRVEHEWPHIDSGQLSGAVVPPDHKVVPIALDPGHRRFAVAQEDGIHVIDCTP